VSHPLEALKKAKPEEWDPVRAHALTQAVASLTRQDAAVAMRTELILARADAFVAWLGKKPDLSTGQDLG
jgi:hypothetical protein